MKTDRGRESKPLVCRRWRVWMERTALTGSEAVGPPWRSTLPTPSSRGGNPWIPGTAGVTTWRPIVRGAGADRRHGRGRYAAVSVGRGGRCLKLPPRGAVLRDVWRTVDLSEGGMGFPTLMRSADAVRGRNTIEGSSSVP